MSVIKKLMMTAAGGEELLAIEDVFSTYLYTGNGSTQTITNGIDLAGEGGMLWVKRRSGGSGTWSDNWIFDSVRGHSNGIRTNLTNANFNIAPDNFGFSSTGFTVPNYIPFSETGTNYTTWTFRKAPRFFDVVTYTGTGSNQNISHNLGVVPGFVVVKRLNTTSYWSAWHRSLQSDAYILLNTTDAAVNAGSSYIRSVTDTTYQVFGAYPDEGANGSSYVAYLFAHDPLGPSGDGSDGLISCGSFVTNGSGAFSVNLGWEPQFILWKRADGSSSWTMFDSMRGLAVTQNSILVADQDAAEQSLQYLIPDATGFSSNPGYFGAGQTYIYIAIRRGPMRQPTSGTEVFAMDTLYSAGSGAPKWDASMPVVDMAIVAANTSSTHNTGVYSRLTQGKYLKTNTTDAEASTADLFGSMYGWAPSATASGPASTYPSWMFRRAPGFFDVVAYTGDGVAGRTVSHNLGVAPEMMWVKRRNSTGSWTVYTSTVGSGNAIFLNDSSAATNVSSAWWNNTNPTDSNFTVGSQAAVNASGSSYISYLFASIDGISKVGSYTGNGTSQTINCGFTGGARFVFIKRIDAVGDWYVFDSLRGIISGNDPFLRFNTTAAEDTSYDLLDPASSGFIVNEVSARNSNTSGASYIFYAIA